MKSKWIQHLKDPKDQEDFKDRIYRAQHVLDRLDTILSELEQGILRSERSPKVYDCANWTHLQAHYNGSMMVLSQIRNLLDLKETE